MARKKSNGAKAAEEHPVFDYTNWNRKKQKAYTRELIRLQRLAQQIDKSVELEWDEEEFEEALVELEEMTQSTEASIMKILVSIPRSWLTPDAPETLDWSDPESLNWLRADKGEALMEEAAEARAPEKVSKNLGKR